MGSFMKKDHKQGANRNELAHTLGEVAWIMSQKRIHRVFLRQAGRIIGVVSSFDVARAVGRASGPALSLR